MSLEFSPATEADVYELVSDILPADETEIRALGFTPTEALLRSVNESLECVAVRKGGRLASIAGVVQPTPLSNEYYPWMISTSMILSHPKEVVRYSRLIYSRWTGMFPVLTNYVDARHERAIKWLTWLGATMELDPAHGPFKRPFYKFVL